MKTRIYLDTSVFGALCDPDLPDRLLATLWVFDGLVRDRWEGFISTLVLEEVDRAPAQALTYKVEKGDKGPKLVGKWSPCPTEGKLYNETLTFQKTGL